MLVSGRVRILFFIGCHVQVKHVKLWEGKQPQEHIQQQNHGNLKVPPPSMPFRNQQEMEAVFRLLFLKGLKIQSSPRWWRSSDWGAACGRWVIPLNVHEYIDTNHDYNRWSNVTQLDPPVGGHLTLQNLTIPKRSEENCQVIYSVIGVLLAV